MKGPVKISFCKYAIFADNQDLALQSGNEIKQELKHSDPGVSEEFLATILRYVDDLCKIIHTGDPNLERTTEINQNLNKAVICYKNKLRILESKDQNDDFGHETKKG